MSFLKNMVLSLGSKTKALYVTFAAAMAVLLVGPAASLAVESEGAKSVKTITTQVSSEGSEIILAVLAGLVALIALVIVLPKAVGFIRRFI